MTTYVITSPEYIEIDDVPLSTPAWETSNADDLWSSPDVRGDDLLVPGGDGVRAYPRRATVTKASIELSVYGDVAPDGSVQSDERIGMAANCDALRALTTSTGVAADGTRLCTLHLAAGGTRSGRAHVLRIRFARNGRNLAVAQLELSIPSGALL